MDKETLTFDKVVTGGEVVKTEKHTKTHPLKFGCSQMATFSIKTSFLFPIIQNESSCIPWYYNNIYIQVAFIKDKLSCLNRSCMLYYVEISSLL